MHKSFIAEIGEAGTSRGASSNWPRRLADDVLDVLQKTVEAKEERRRSGRPA